MWKLSGEDYTKCELSGGGSPRIDFNTFSLLFVVARMVLDIDCITEWLILKALWKIEHTSVSVFSFGNTQTLFVSFYCFAGRETE